VDVLENGPSRPPLDPRTKLLLSILAGVALVALIAVRGWPHGPAAVAQAPTATATATAVPLPISPPSVAPARSTPPQHDRPIQVGEHVRIDAGYTLTADGHDFVLAYGLTDDDNSHPSVTAGAVHPPAGFARLAVAAAPVRARPSDPTFAEIEAAAPRHVTVSARSPARLYIAGRVICPNKRMADDRITLLVNGEKLSTRLPVIAGQGWEAAAMSTVCS
jgi:hypothetical protein